MSNLLPLKKIADEKSIFKYKWQEVIYRNYGRIPNDVLAEVLSTTKEEIISGAQNLGLSKIMFNESWLSKGYITLIYDNWKILPYSQLLQLLGWNEEQLGFALKENDFLGEKLGGFKPDVAEVKYNKKENEPFIYKEYIEKFSPNDKLAFNFRYGTICCKNKINIINDTDIDINEIISVVQNLYEDISNLELKFIQNDFLSEEEFIIEGSTIVIGKKSGALRALQAIIGDKKGDGHYRPTITNRIIYGYEAGCGDILDLDIDKQFPDEYLCGLCREKINGIWIHAIFYQLVDFYFCREFSIGYEKRIKKLNELTKKLDKYGIKLYLYINEPRCMPESFFEKNEDILGQKLNGFGSMCTSTQKVKDYLKYASKSVAQSIPLLGGFISITMSENLTHCYSKGQCKCPRCLSRKIVDVVAETNNIIYKGLEEANTGAKLIAWTWAWLPVLSFQDEDIVKCISLHDKNIEIMCTSEDGLEYQNNVISDYSVSHIGPSKKTIRSFEQSRKDGHKLFAKIQLNNSWECPAIPYIPLYDIQLQNVENMVKQNVDGIIVSWTLGGYSSPVLKYASEIYFYGLSKNEVLDKFFNHNAKIINCFEKLSKAFQNMPICTMFMYVGPVSRGPALKMFKDHSNNQSSMIGYVYDDYKYWLDGQDEDEFLNKLSLVIKDMEEAIVDLGEGEEKDMAKSTICLVKSSYNYLRYSITKGKDILKNEYENCLSIFSLMGKDGRIGYETSNHYLFTQRSVLEKMIAIKEEEILYDEKNA